MNSPISGTSQRAGASRRLRAALLAVAVVAPVCGSFAAAGVAAAAPSSAPLVVWVDSTRVPMVKAYEKAFPNVKIDLVVYNGNANGSGVLQSKIALYNRVGSGWPDIVFSEENNDAASLANAQFHYPAALNNGLVPSSVLDGFAKGTMAGCTINGTVYCLRNDLAQNLFWYNSALMKQFGYSVPTTWQQWQALGEQVAAHHPGYLVGSAGDTWTDDLYLWPSRCPANDVVGPNTIEINLSSPNCTRAAALVDPLIKDGSVTLESVFSSTFDKTYTDKILALVGPSWYGADLFPGLVPKGDLAAADPLSWAGQKPATGEVGGGLWFMSSHSKNPAAAAAMLTWLSTSWGSQGISVGYPAYVADQTKWIAGQQASGFYSDQIGPVFATAATEIWPDWSPVPWSTDSIWASTVSPALTSGSTMVSQLAAYGQQLTDFAQSDGYTVVTKS